ncbi:MAG: hydantoinase/oxoprolinase family protein [Armatimonadetes bacterium]|nr:hydantoinase/oxoprolinase family protein [Armatimonadota bacterium]
MARALVGVDIGGTFTDLVWVADGRLRTHKLPSTPPDYARAVLAGLAHFGQLPAAVAHGSTVATNALLERRGARCGLITTAGFRDVLAIGRQNRPSLYDLDQPAPVLLIPRELRREVAERVAPDGTVLQPLDPAEAERVLDELLAAGCEAVAIGFLFSFVRPGHEQTVAKLAAERGLYVSASHVIHPEFREYERIATTAVNAYVGPLMARYLGRLGDALGACPLRVMQSNGGITDAATAGREAVRTVLSGPAAGVVGAWGVARAVGCRRAVSFDMGGTSTDVALLDGGLPITTASVVAGLPIGVPALDIHTVGAGGGSLARRDAGGALTVGPESAGAEPGPACYGRGGRLATVTDANLVLGRLPEDRFLGGRMRLDRGLAEEAVGRLAAELGLSLVDTARGILTVANAAMERAIRVISIERGADPRDFVLLSFGGAGGLHAAELAASLGLAGVLVPPHPGTLAALGLLLAEVVRDGARTVMAPLAELSQPRLAAWFAELAAPEASALNGQGLAMARVERWVDVRYRGQSHELMLPCPASEPAAVAAEFHAAHERRYGYARRDAAVELVTVRVRVVAEGEPPELPERRAGSLDAARLGQREIDCGGPVSAELYDLERLPAGAELPGPAVLAGDDTTVLVPPAWRAQVGRLGEVRLLSRGGAWPADRGRQ